MNFTVGITNFNHAPTLGRAIDSALKQGAEVIVADNASTDGSVELLERYTGRITTFLHKENSGNGVLGSNECMDAATGEWFMVLDADDTLGGGALRTFEANAEGHDWLVADLNLWSDKGDYITRWCYEQFPRDREGALLYMNEHRQLPISMKGTFRLAWIREHGLRWRSLPSTLGSWDVATCLEWLEASPRIGYINLPLVNYSYRPGNLPEDQRAGMLHDMEEYLKRGTWA